MQAICLGRAIMTISRRTVFFQILAGILLILLVGCKGGSGPISPTGPQGPKAAFTQTDPNNCVVGKTVLFDASASTDSIIKIAQYIWNWGDNSPNNTSTTTSASHIFAKAQIYKVTLTVIDKAGIQASISQNIRILVPGSGAAGMLHV